MMLLFMFLKGTFAGTMSGTLNALIAEISGYTYRTKGVIWISEEMFFISQILLLKRTILRFDFS